MYAQEPTPLDYKSATAILSALRSAKAVIDMLADNGQYFDNLDRTMGLQGTLDRAIALVQDDGPAQAPARPIAPPPTSATWAKLRGGEFGIRVPGAAAPIPGQAFTVVSRAGKASTVTVDRVMWSGTDFDGSTRIHLCTIAKTTGPRYH